MIIQTATVDDAKQIAFVHTEAWKTTYKNIVSDEYLNNLNVEAKTKYWEKILNEKRGNVFVAEEENIIVGFATGGKSRDTNNFDSELYAIYFLQNHQRKNIGRKLFTETAKYLLANGHRSMYVWVLDNNNSKHIYERIDGILFDEKIFEIGKQQLKEVVFGWHNINQFV